MPVEAFDRLAIGTVVTILVTPDSNLNNTTATIIGWERSALTHADSYILDNGTKIWTQPAWTCYEP